MVLRERENISYANVYRLPSLSSIAVSSPVRESRKTLPAQGLLRLLLSIRVLQFVGVFLPRSSRANMAAIGLASTTNNESLIVWTCDFPHFVSPPPFRQHQGSAIAPILKLIAENTVPLRGKRIRCCGQGTPTTTTISYGILLWPRV